MFIPSPNNSDPEERVEIPCFASADSFPVMGIEALVGVYVIFGVKYLFATCA